MFFKPVNILSSQTLKKTFAALFSQGLLSISNLMIGICLIKYSSKENYGLYATANATLLFFLGLQNALITTPLIVLSPHKSIEEKDRFFSGLRSNQFLIFIPLTILLVVLLQIFFRVTISLSPFAFMIFGLTVFLGLSNELIRSIFYSELMIRKVIKIDLTFIVTLGIFISLLIANQAVNATNMIMILGASNFVSTTFGGSLLSIPMKFSLMLAKDSFKETWGYSQWSLMGVIFTFLQTWGYVYLVSTLLSLKDTADISVARLIMMPINLLILSWAKIFMPKGTMLLKERNITKLNQLYFFACGILIVILCLYLLLIFLGKNFILSTLLSTQYKNIWNYLFWWGFVFALMIIRSNASLYLQILKQFKFLAIAVMVSSFITLSSTIVLLKMWGALGSILAVGIGEIILGVACWLFLKLVVKKNISVGESVYV